MRRPRGYVVAGVVAILAFLAGRYSITVQPTAKVWIGQNEASVRAAFGKPLRESDYYPIGGPVHVILYRGVSVHISEGRVITLTEYDPDRM